MRIIFLDWDGVLNVIPEGHDEFGAIPHRHFVENLDKIIRETGAKIVFTANMRLDGLDKIREMWDKRKYPGCVLDITPVNSNIHGVRGEEIDHWLQKHKNQIESYVILDDDDDMLEYQMDRFVYTNENFDHEDCVDAGFGLTDQCAKEAIRILKRDIF